MSDEMRDDAFRAWWKGYAPGEGLTAKDTAARSFAKVVWVAGYAAGARQEHSEHLRRVSESLERALVEQRAEEGRA